MKILYIGSLSYKKNRLDGVTIKSRVLEKWFYKNNFNIEVIDVDNWKKNFFFIVYNFIKKYNKSDKIVICSSSHGAAVLLKFLKIIQNEKDIYYFVAGGKLADMIKCGKFDVSLYNEIKKIYVEPIKMVKDLMDLGLKNINHINNFREVLNRPQLKMCKNEIKFVFYSRVVKEKGIEELIRAFLELKNKYNNIKLDIYGQVDKHYYSKIKNNIRNGISYKGSIIPNGSDEYMILSNYDVFVLPTYHQGEGLPGALIDAYISGLAVLVSNWPYASQYVDDGEVGLIHEYKNYISLYNKMEYIIMNINNINIYKTKSYKKADDFLVDNVLKNFKNDLIK